MAKKPRVITSLPAVSPPTPCARAAKSEIAIGHVAAGFSYLPGGRSQGDQAPGFGQSRPGGRSKQQAGGRVGTAVAEYQERRLLDADYPKGKDLAGKSVAEIADRVLPALTAAMNLLKQQDPGRGRQLPPHRPRRCRNRPDAPGPAEPRHGRDGPQDHRSPRRRQGGRRGRRGRAGDRGWAGSPGAAEGDRGDGRVRFRRGGGFGSNRRGWRVRRRPDARSAPAPISGAGDRPRGGRGRQCRT
ncbi:hypothetical protein SAMN05421811_122111 [Nonomuraea wenchangensis]|uniref:Uncharacterized protein n=1 Tax=Nonomuraea wenchangensis TaxID=568860 RepID=A0A1I0LSR1_9ACTN|nr:hypothetical protein SAMN05421811_122111 [Nonomuraea wenchangensis]